MGSLYGGFAAAKEAKAQAKIAREQAAVEARRAAEEDRDFRSQMKMSYLKSGVTLEGTPLETIARAKAQSEQDVMDILKSGAARASSLKRRGRDAMVGGVLGAGETAVKMYATGGASAAGGT